MDVFKFLNPTHPTLLDQGQLVNGLKSKMWVERYRDAGEFEFVALAETNMHLFLPIGTMVSHVDTDEVMIVENHEIKEEEGSETEITITGRSLEVFFENRVVGSNKEWPTDASANQAYVLTEDFTWNQAIQLVFDHIDPSVLFDDDDALEHIQMITDVSGSSVSVERTIPRGPLYQRLMELLAIDNLGIKSLRPGVRSPLGAENEDIVFLIHFGEDLSGDVAFSYTTGEIVSAEYLWSIKKMKNAALISGRWLETVVKDDSVGINRRWMYIDASDLDNEFSVPPDGSERDEIISAMQVRGEAALMAQRNVALVNTEPKKDSSMFRYREHYDVGDIITVDGQYNETTTMRISEFVEVEDEEGQTGYPTLSAVE